MSEELVKSPEKAMWYVEQELMDASNPGGVAAITVHQRKDYAVCNVWIKIKGKWQRDLPERVIKGKPNKFMMQGEVFRLAQTKFEKLNNDLRTKLIVLGLQGAVNAL